MAFKNSEMAIVLHRPNPSSENHSLEVVNVTYYKLK